MRNAVQWNATQGMAMCLLIQLLKIAKGWDSKSDSKTMRKIQKRVHEGGFIVAKNVVNQTIDATVSDFKEFEHLSDTNTHPNCVHAVRGVLPQLFQHVQTGAGMYSI